MRLLFPICLLASFVFVATKINSQTIYVPNGTIGVSSNSNVGIGVSTPTEKFEVVGNISLSGTNSFLGTKTNSALYLRTNNINRLIITPDGNFGIGTTSPGTATLMVYKNQLPTFEIKSSLTRLQIGIANSGFDFANSSKPGDVVFRNLGAPTSNNLIFYIPNNTNDGNSYISFGDDFNGLWYKIFNNKTVSILGSVGINTQAVAGHKLAVNGSMLVENGALNLSNGLVANGPAVFNGNVKFKSEDKYLEVLYGWQQISNCMTLHANDSQNYKIPMVFAASSFYFDSGKVGIGNRNPVGMIDVVAENTLGFKLNHSSSTDGVAAEITVNRETTKALGVLNGTQQTFAVHGDGSVAIGTAPKPFGYMLSVAGKIITEELVVKLKGNWPDYVFAPTYRLMPLAQVEEYFNTNGHLPQVPSAKKVQEQGVNVGEMNAILLKKIEELTLYAIELNKTIKVLEEKVNKLETNNN